MKYTFSENPQDNIWYLCRELGRKKEILLLAVEPRKDSSPVLELH